MRNGSALAAGAFWRLDIRRNTDDGAEASFQHLEHELPLNALLIQNVAGEHIMVYVGRARTRRIFVAAGAVVSVDQLEYEQLDVENLHATDSIDAGEIALTMQRRFSMYDLKKTLQATARPGAKEIRFR